MFMQHNTLFKFFGKMCIAPYTFYQLEDRMLIETCNFIFKTAAPAEMDAFTVNQDAENTASQANLHVNQQSCASL